jgi:outer membrane protein OmpA-like peptidoglycan-associated protein
MAPVTPRIRTAAVAAALACGCAAEHAVAPEQPAPAAVLRTADLSRIRCVLLAPLENGSDSPRAADAAAEGLASAIDPRSATVLPIRELRSTFKGTPMELPPGIGPPLALELADLLAADAALSGAVEGRSTGASPELVVSVRLASAADRAVLFARTIVVRPGPSERPEDVVSREVASAARPALAELGNAAPRRCFDPVLIARVRSLAMKKAATALPAPPPPAPPPAPATAPARPKPLPLTERQAAWARRLGSGERVVLEDVTFVGRTAELERATGLDDLAAALAAASAGRLGLEGFVDTTSDPMADALLSRAMADAVAERLAGLGVSRARLAPAGRGGDQPIVPNFTARGRATNRRVEAILQR